MMPLDWVLDQTLEVFTDEERAENWKFLRRVIAREVPPEEFHARIGQLERAIEIARENRVRRNS